MGIIESLVTALSLCADCFAVSLCSSVTLKKIEWRNVSVIAIVFAFIQTGLLVLGFAFGSAISGMVDAVAHVIGFLLLMYVGVSMLVEGIRGSDEVRDLNGWRNMIVAGVATSIDALAVGVSQSIEGQVWTGFVPLAVSVFAVTLLSVVLGILGGGKMGKRLGRRAEIAGGLVLSLIALQILL